MNYECIACTTTPKSEFLELANTYFEHNFLLQRWYFSFLTLGRPKHSCKHSLNLEALFHPPCVWKGMKPGDLQRERLWHFKQDWTIQQTTQSQTKSAELAQSVCGPVRISSLRCSFRGSRGTTCDGISEKLNHEMYWKFRGPFPEKKMSALKNGWQMRRKTSDCVSVQPWRRGGTLGVVKSREESFQCWQEKEGLTVCRGTRT